MSDDILGGQKYMKDNAAKIENRLQNMKKFYIKVGQVYL